MKIVTARVSNGCFKNGGVMMDLFNGTIRSLENTLNYATAKHQAISDNISNVDTPNYKSKAVVFKNVLNDSLSNQIETKRTNSKHFSFSQHTKSYQTISRQNTTFNHNGNNVDMDKEMTDLAKNQIYYQGLVDRINGKFSSLQTVIRGGA